MALAAVVAVLAGMLGKRAAGVGWEAENSWGDGATGAGWDGGTTGQ